MNMGELLSPPWLTGACLCINTTARKNAPKRDVYQGLARRAFQPSGSCLAQTKSGIRAMCQTFGELPLLLVGNGGVVNHAISPDLWG